MNSSKNVAECQWDPAFRETCDKFLLQQSALVAKGLNEFDSDWIGCVYSPEKMDNLLGTIKNTPNHASLYPGGAFNSFLARQLQRRSPTHHASLVADTWLHGSLVLRHDSNGQTYASSSVGGPAGLGVESQLLVSPSIRKRRSSAIKRLVEALKRFDLGSRPKLDPTQQASATGCNRAEKQVASCSSSCVVPKSSAQDWVCRQNLKTHKANQNNDPLKPAKPKKSVIQELKACQNNFRSTGQRINECLGGKSAAQDQIDVPNEEILKLSLESYLFQKPIE